MKWLIRWLLKWVAVLALLAVAAVAVYALIGDFAPPRADQTLPVTIDVQ